MTVRRQLLTLVLALFVGFLGGVVGSVVYTKIATKKVLGASDTHIKSTPKTKTSLDFDGIKVSIPEGFAFEKTGKNNTSKLVLYTSEGSATIEKNPASSEKIKSMIDCDQTEDCTQTIIGQNTYTKVIKNNSIEFITTNGQDLITTTFSSLSSPIQNLILSSLELQ